MFEKILLIVCSVLLLVVIVMLVLLLVKKSQSSPNNEKMFQKLNDDFEKEISHLKQEIDNKLTNSFLTVNQNNQQANDLTNQKMEAWVKQMNVKTHDLTEQIQKNTDKSEQYLESIRLTLQTQMEKLQQENAKKIEEMRVTVDEKLEKTLNARLQESFKNVQDNLLKVESGLGEMRVLAQDVGDLKHVLTNSKTKGIWGEIQLGVIIENVLTTDMYKTNIKTVPDSTNPVEYAIVLPGKVEEPIYLPIDSKFPLNPYHDLLDTYDQYDKKLIEKAQKALRADIVRYAKDIGDKYIKVPYTTDFGIMYVPIEGMYAEIVKMGLVEELQTKYHIVLAGPTTMTALINSLLVGFKTLAIERQSAKIYQILGEVKKEFATYAKTLEQAQKKIDEASKDIDNLVGTRARAMNRKLADIEIKEIEFNKESKDEI